MRGIITAARYLLIFFELRKGWLGGNTPFTHHRRTDGGIYFGPHERLGRIQALGAGRAAHSRHSHGQPSVKPRFRFHQLPKGE
jgi:hypothetical protein